MGNESISHWRFNNIGFDNCGSIIPIVLDMLAIEGLALLGQMDRARKARPQPRGSNRFSHIATGVTFTTLLDINGNYLT
jgi:hypothetical protein